MKSKKNKITGMLNSTVGKIKQTAGKIINDKDLETQGLMQEAKGKGQQLLSATQKKIQKGSTAIGKMAHKVEHA